MLVRNSRVTSLLRKKKTSRNTRVPDVVVRTVRLCTRNSSYYSDPQVRSRENSRGQHPSQSLYDSRGKPPAHACAALVICMVRSAVFISSLISEGQTAIRFDGRRSH